MSDDYLWDKSGAPDPETERLEQMLGRLHYQPQPLNLPLDPPVTTSRRVLFPSLAAAAAVALIAVAVGVWMSWQESKKGTALSTVATVNIPEAKKDQKDAAVKPRDETGGRTVPATSQRPRRHASRYQGEESQPGIVKASLTEEERAKAQLMLALHIASSKFNLAQKKIQAGDKGVPRS